MTEERLARLEDKVDSLDRLLRGGNGSGMGLNGQVGLISTEQAHTNERIDALTQSLDKRLTTMARGLWLGVSVFITAVLGLALDRLFG